MKKYTVVLKYPQYDYDCETYLAHVQARSVVIAVEKAREAMEVDNSWSPYSASEADVLFVCSGHKRDLGGQ